MNNFKTTLCIFAAMTLAAFALPGVAGNDKKQFSITMSSPAVQPPLTYTVQAMIANEGNSTINSFQLSYSGGLTIVGVVQPPSGNATFTANSVTFKNLHPIKPGAPLTVTIDMSTCAGDNPGTWSGTAWTGSQLNGQSFNLGADSVLTTPVSCGTLAAGAEINVVNSNNPASCFMGQRGFYDQDGGVRGGVQYFVTNNVYTEDPTLHFKWPDDAITGDPFAAFEYDVCAPGSTAPALETVQVAWLNTLGGSASSGTPKFVQAQACNDYANFLPAPYGVLNAQIGTDDTTITVNALATLDPLSLHGGPFSPLQTNGTIKHPVIGAPLPDKPDVLLTSFDIVIDGERMTVTNVNSDDGQGGDLSDCVDYSNCGGTSTQENETEIETWTVTRGVGLTTHSAHNQNALVMSTPKPLLPSDGVPSPYVPGAPAQMCVKLQQSSDPGSGSHTTTFIDDGGDGWGSHP